MLAPLGAQARRNLVAPVLLGGMVLALVPGRGVCAATHPDLTGMLAYARAAVIASHIDPRADGIAWTSFDITFADTSVCVMGDLARVKAVVDERVGMAGIDGNTGVPEASYGSGPATFTVRHDGTGWRLVKASLSV